MPGGHVTPDTGFPPQRWRQRTRSAPESDGRLQESLPPFKLGFEAPPALDQPASSGGAARETRALAASVVS